ncbi:MAG: hypothetical protein HQL99_00310 [Magnetococcales bacterium]|nr:hypothetical protein [Magnetococcales bacterium]
MKRITFWSRLGMVMGLLTSGSLLAGELVVYKAEGIQLTPGQTLDTTQPLTLAIGQRVTLLASNGTAINLEGPFQGLPLSKPQAATETGVVNTLKMLVSSPKIRSGGLGTTRSIPQMLDVTRSGHYCLSAGQPLVFWRPSSQEHSRITVRLGQQQWKAHSQWPAGTHQLTPPPTMPVTDNTVYRLELDGQPSTTTLHVMPSNLTTPTERTAWMTAKGCDAQLSSLNRVQTTQ